MLARNVSLFAVVAAVLLGGAPARAVGVNDLPGIDLTRGLRLMPSAQLDDPLSFLPKGDLGGDPVVWPIAIGQYVASAAISVGGVYLFNKLAVAPAGATQDDAKKRLILAGVAQFLTVPLVSATAVWGVGMADDFRDPGYAWPLVANYGAELILVAVKLGLGLGGLKGGDAANLVVDLLGQFAAVDYVLHAIVVPVTVTYFSIRSRGPKGISLGLGGAPSVPVTVLPPLRAETATREASMTAPVASAALQLPLVAATF